MTTDAPHAAAVTVEPVDEYDFPERSPMGRPGPLAWLLLLPVHLYRKLIGPLLPPSCRFYPSCSAYAVEALTRHGAAKGLYLASRRLLRCGPWHPGGIDEVPERFRWRSPRPDSPTQERPS